MLVFIVTFLLTQSLAYQQYLIFNRTEFEKIAHEASLVGTRLKTALSHSLSATKTLAFIVEKYGVPDDFDSIAVEILEANDFIDAIQLTRKGVITHVYPKEGNEEALGFDVLTDPEKRKEALTAISNNDLFFAGPFELKQGGIAVVGRLPIIKDNSFWGFSVVIIRFSTLLQMAGLDGLTHPDFTYQLAKDNPGTGKPEFFLPGEIPSADHYVSIDVPDGAWRVYVMPKRESPWLSQILPFSLLGILLSITASSFAWQLARQPQKLNRTIERVKSEMTTYQRSATASLQSINRLYHFTSKVNHMAVHVQSEDDMFQQVCKIAIDVGRFKLAWIGLINEENETIIARSSAGDEMGYLAKLTPIAIGHDAVEGPALRMIRTGQFVYCNDIENNPIMKPWHRVALDHGYRSSILLPIRRLGKIVGSFNLYSHHVNNFDENEIHLLSEVTDNISFTLDNFENDRLRRSAEQQINAEKILSESIINSMPGVFYLYNKEGKFFRWNRNFETVTGYSPEEISRMHPLDFINPEDRPSVGNAITAVFKGDYNEVTAAFLTKNKKRIPYYFNGRKVSFSGVEYLIGMGVDITDRMKTEHALLERTEEIEKLSAHLQDIREEERARIALEIHDVLGQQLTALKMDSTWLKKRTVDDPALQERATTMILLIDDTIKTVRRISTELRPGILDDLGLVAALEWQGAEFQKNTGIIHHFKMNCNNVPLDRNGSTNIFRIFQEALTNIARHAEATEVWSEVSLEQDSVVVSIRDNGKGINLDEVKKKKSLGLISMKERARTLVGEIIIENVLPHGTMVRLRLPVLNPLMV